LLSSNCSAGLEGPDGWNWSHLTESYSN